MLHVFVLGEQAIADAAGVVRMRSARAIALVAFLALHADRPQPRQRIAALFWPDSTEAQALTNLRRELHHLRAAMPDEAALVVTARELCWRDTETCSVDLRVFTRERDLALAAAATTGGDALAHADAAVTEYRGEFMPGGFDDWLLDARAELESGCVGLLDLISQIRSRTSEPGRAVESARRRIELRPLEEIGYRTLMTLQGQLGERAGAVSTYHHCASVLERELGVEPDPATRALLNQLLARSESSDGPAEPSSRAATKHGRPGQPARTGPARAQLIGRIGELDALTSLWDRAAAGRPGIALVHGDAGLGKTRLVAEVATTAAASGALVASAQCFGPAGRLALSPVADWLRTPAVQAGLSTLEPVWQVEVERLVPASRGRMPADAGTRTMVDSWQRHRFFEGLARALMGTGRPLLLVLDNLQWCDQETLAFLTFSLRLSTDAPVLVAATMRTDADQEVFDWTALMRGSGLVTDIELRPLDVTETGELAAAMSGQPLRSEDADLLHAATGGFPLYIVEAARGWSQRPTGRLPVGDLTAVLRGRLEPLGADARDIAGLAAAVGRPFTLDLLAEASDLDADSVVGAVDELWRHRIVREFGDGYDFSHDLLRDSAYTQVSPPKRWLLHRRLAQALELLHADDLDAVVAQLAEQYVKGGRAERAFGYYRRAADNAAAMFAHAEAIRLDSEALAILRAQPATRDRTRHELEVLEAMAAPLTARYGYSSPRLRETLERWLALAEDLGSLDLIAHGLVGLWSSQFVQGQTAAAYRTGTRALELLEPGSPLSGTAHFAVGGSALNLGRPAEAVEHLELAATLGAGEVLAVGTRADVHTRAFAAHAHWLLGRVDRSLASSDDAVALARTVENPYSLAMALAYAAVTHQMHENADALRATVDELRELCERYDFAYYREWALILDGWSRVDGTGAPLAQRGIANLIAEGAFARMPYWQALFADVSAREQRPDAARGILDAAIVRGQASDETWWLPEVMRLRARHDDQPAAIARLRAAQRLAGSQGSVALRARCTADLAALGV